MADPKPAPAPSPIPSDVWATPTAPPLPAPTGVPDYVRKVPGAAGAVGVQMGHPSAQKNLQNEVRWGNPDTTALAAANVTADPHVPTVAETVGRFAGTGIQHGLELFTVPRRLGWHASAWAGAKLGETAPEGMKQAATEVIGGAMSLPFQGIHMLDAPAQLVLAEQFPGKKFGQDDPFSAAEETAKAGPDLYRAWLNGDLYRESLRGADPVEWMGGWSVPDLTGSDLLDIAMPKERAAKIRDMIATGGLDAAKKGNVAAWGQFNLLATSDSYRMVQGMMPEILFDPLMFTGVSPGSKVVSVGNQTFRVSPMVVRAGEALRVAEGGDDLVVPLKTLVGAARTGEAGPVVNRAVETLRVQAQTFADRAAYFKGLSENADDAVSFAARNLEDATAALRRLAGIRPSTAEEVALHAQAVQRAQLAQESAKRFADLVGTDPAAAAGALTRMAQDAMAASQSARRGIGALRTFEAMAQPGGQLGHITPKGVPGLEWATSVHWGDRTYGLTGPARPVLDALNARLVTPLVDGIVDLAQPYRYDTLAELVRTGANPATDFTPGAALAWAVHTNAAVRLGQQGVAWMLGLPAVGFTVLARILGPRTFLPFVVDMSKAYGLETFTENVFLPGAAALGGSKWRYVRPPSAEVAQAYTDLTTSFIARLGGREADVQSSVYRIAQELQRVRDARAAAAKQGFGPAIWGDAQRYTADDILTEAIDSIDRGRGALRQDLAPIADELSKLQEIVQDAGGVRYIEDVKQALVAAWRKGQGDPARFREVLKAADDLDELWRVTRGAARDAGGGFEDVLSRYGAASKAVKAALEAASPQELALALDAFEAATRTRALSDVALDRMAVEALVTVTKGDALTARHLLAALARVTGTADPSQALTAFREIAMGAAPRGTPLHEAIRLLRDSSEQGLAQVQRALASTTADWPTVAAALSSSAGTHLARARAYVGDAAWPVFIDAMRQGAPDAVLPAAWRPAAGHWQASVAELTAMEAALSARVRAAKGLSARQVYREVLVERINALDTLLDPATKAHLTSVARFGKDASSDGAEAIRAQRSLADIAAEAVGRELPRLPVTEPNGVVTHRAMEDWEIAQWETARTMLRTLHPDDATRVVMATLREVAPLPKDMPGYAEWAGRYGVRPGDVLGERYGELPEDLKPLVAELRRLRDEYERVFRETGLVTPMDTSKLMIVNGVVEYFPHRETAESVLQRARAMKDVAQYGSPVSGSPADSVETALSLSLDAAKRRKIAGTIAEINASTTSPITMKTDLGFILSRYLSNAKAVSAQEYLYGLAKAEVIQVVKPTNGKTAAQVAAERGLVPLFSRPELTRDWHMLLRGGRDALMAAGVTPEELATAQRALSGPQASGFAAWTRTAPTIMQARNIEQMLLHVRQAEYAAGSRVLFDPEVRFGEIMAAMGREANEDRAWMQVADEFNDIAGRAGAPSKTAPAYLKAYFDPDKPLFSLYVPAAVAQSIDDMFNLRSIVPQGLVATAKDVLDTLARFWKVRVTIINPPFHNRNWFGNTISSMFDVAADALNPVYHLRAAQITQAAAFRSEYGSLELARQALSAPRGPAESAYAFMRRKSIYELVFRGGQVESMLRDGVDLGDGIVRNADTVLDELTRKQVLTGAYSNFADLAMFQHDVATALARGGPEALKNRLINIASKAEDLALVVGSSAITGGIPVVLPKGLGGAIAHNLENQSRVVNLLANVRRFGSVDEAARHVQQFLFNYSDLNAMQKVYLRSIIPFWTWPTKNLALQMELVLSRPSVYTAYSHLFGDQFIRATEAVNADLRGDPVVQKDRADTQLIQLRDAHVRARVRLPVPGAQRVELVGWGTNPEAAFEIGSMIADPVRLVALTHWGVRGAIELIAGKDTYYNKPLDELNNAARLTAVLTGMRRFHDVPLVGPVMDHAADELARTTNYHQFQVRSPRTGEIITLATADPMANYFMANNPYQQAVGNSMAISDTLHISLADQLVEGGDNPSAQPIPDYLRYADALMALSATQEDEAYMQRKRDREVREQMHEEESHRGQIRDTTVYSAPSPK